MNLSKIGSDDDSDEGNGEGDEWQELQLSKHNTYRATHQSPSMVLDDKLSQGIRQSMTDWHKAF